MEGNLLEIASEEGETSRLDTQVEFLKAHLCLKDLGSVKMAPQAGTDEVIVYEENNGFVEYSLDGAKLIKKEMILGKETVRARDLVDPKLATDGRSVFVIADRSRKGSQVIKFSCLDRCGDVNFCGWQFFKEEGHYSRVDFSDFVVKDGGLQVAFNSGETAPIMHGAVTYCNYRLGYAVEGRTCYPPAIENPDGSYSFGECSE